MTDLPNREAAGQAVAFAYRNLKGSGAEIADLVALGIHWSMGRLVDREVAVPMVRMGGLSPAWYPQEEDDPDEPDGWFIPNDGSS